MKVALVHDYLTRLGGAERVLLELAAMFPDAPIYTFLYDGEKMSKYFSSGRVKTSFLQKFPGWWKNSPKYLLPFLPVAAELFDLRDFDLVISSSSSFAKGVVTRSKTIHICYCHNPSRFLWDYRFEYLRQQKLGLFRSVFVKLLMSYLRLWDRAASQRADYFIVNSRATAGRVEKFYRRQAKVIYPPVSAIGNRQSAIGGDNAGNYFLIVSQLVCYKRIDVAVEAFNKLGLPLVIIGEGPQEKYLKSLAKENINILGWREDGEIEEYYKNCAAFIFPGEDDFGIAPVEAMNFGRPVLAFKAGGAEETILPGITGEFFEAQTPEVLADGVRRLRENMSGYSPLLIRKWAEKFSKERFRNEIMEFVRKVGYN